MAILVFFSILAVLNFATEAKIQWKDLNWSLSVGQIVGIAVGCSAFIILIIIILVLCYKRMLCFSLIRYASECDVSQESFNQSTEP
ncbi:MAG: hypothetical protein EZS28_017857 [Streblomastix strix]|uniref:Uncharacterized protein n=1 Tax=Streblomastix strix TaxID=222440 RepID=A0A5J4VVQ6_9EUKA|nr:MAG: hypothetical protein EZS28_017857 [Streblomastix strix]